MCLHVRDGSGLMSRPARAAAAGRGADGADALQLREAATAHVT